MRERYLADEQAIGYLEAMNVRASFADRVQFTQSSGQKWTALAKGVPAKVKVCTCFVRANTILTRVQSYEPVILWAAEFELHMRDTRKANDKL